MVKLDGKLDGNGKVVTAVLTSVGGTLWNGSSILFACLFLFYDLVFILRQSCYCMFFAMTKSRQQIQC